MKHKIYPDYLLINLGLNLLLMACLTTPLVVEGKMPTPVVTLIAAEPSPTPEPTTTVQPTNTLVPTRTRPSPPPAHALYRLAAHV